MSPTIESTPPPVVSAETTDTAGTTADVAGGAGVQHFNMAAGGVLSTTPPALVPPQPSDSRSVPAAPQPIITPVGLGAFRSLTASSTAAPLETTTTVDERGEEERTPMEMAAAETLAAADAAAAADDDSRKASSAPDKKRGAASSQKRNQAPRKKAAPKAKKAKVTWGALSSRTEPVCAPSAQLLTLIPDLNYC